jgi:hypothetical protein
LDTKPSSPIRQAARNRSGPILALLKGRNEHPEHKSLPRRSLSDNGNKRRRIVTEQKNQGTPQGVSEQKNPGGLGQRRGQGGQQLPGHETSQTGAGQQTPDQVTLGDVTDPSPGHHQPPGQEALPGQVTSKTNQQTAKPAKGGKEGVLPDDKQWEKGSSRG